MKAVYPFVFFPFMLGFGILGGLLGLIFTIFWILMLIDVVQRKFKDPNEKLIWVLIIIFTHIIGALLYYFLVKKRHRR